jgi:hypothetical protein
LDLNDSLLSKVTDWATIVEEEELREKHEKEQELM